MGDKRPYKPRKPGAGRKPLKPNYDAAAILQEQIQAAVVLYEEDNSLQTIADTLSLNPIKVRKLLITAGVYESEIADAVNSAFEEKQGMPYKEALEAVAAELNVSKASVTSYLPYKKGVYVVNELDVPILCMGLKDVVVSASPEGILVSDKEQSSYIKPYVNTLDHRVMFAEKSWGSFKVIDIDKASMTIKVTLNAGHQMNYHSHQHRDEVWTVIAGKGKTIVDGMEQNVKAGDVITMSAGCRHTVIAETELRLIEVQLGEAIDVHDKQKFELEY